MQDISDWELLFAHRLVVSSLYIHSFLFLGKRKAPFRMLNLAFFLCSAPFPLYGNCGSDSDFLALTFL